MSNDLTSWLVIHSLAHAYRPPITLDMAHRDRRIMAAVNVDRGYPWWFTALVIQRAQACLGVKHE